MVLAGSWPQCRPRARWSPEKSCRPRRITNMNAVFKFALVMSAIPLLTAQKVEKFPLRSLEGLEPQHLEAKSVHYRGRRHSLIRNSKDEGRAHRHSHQLGF